MITPQSATDLANWIAQQEPALFAALQREAATAGARLNGVTDFLSNIGSSISNAVSNVASYVSSSEGMQNLVKLGSSILQSKAQQNVLQTQLNLARAGQAPAPIVNTYPTGTTASVPVYQPTNMPVTQSMLSNLQPSLLQQYALPITIGVGGLVLVMFMSALRK